MIKQYKTDSQYFLNGKDPENSDNLPEGEIVEWYLQHAYGIINRCYPEWLEPHEIIEAVRYSMNKRYKESPLTIQNSYNKREASSTTLNLANMLLDDTAIITTQGCLFRKHGSCPNPFIKYVEMFLDTRDRYKTEMKKHPPGSEEYNKYNLLQLTAKVACNAIYGAAGQFSSIFYNKFLASSVTGQGRGCISAAICMFEGTLANNMKFESLTETLTYIENICCDVRTKPSKFNDWDVLDRNISPEECFLHVFKLTGYNSWVPTDRDVKIIWDTIHNLSQKELNKIYYTNNLYEFIGNSRLKALIMKILTELEIPFLNPLEPSKSVKHPEDIELIKDLIFEYVYYRHLWIDKLPRVYEMQRDVVLITDTDSCIVSLDEWYKTILPWTIGVPMAIKYTEAQRIEAADRVVMEYRRTEMEEEYDFYNDELVAKKRKKYPAVVISEDNLRFSIINIMSYVMGEMAVDYMILFSENYNTKQDGVECKLFLKNEFTFGSLLLTHGRKNYSDIQLVREGHLVPYEKQFDIKGMPISKVGTAKATAEILSDILQFDVLRNNFVNQVDLIRKFATLEKKIYKSIESGNKEFHKPARIKSMYNYDNPLRVQGIKAAIAYNEIKEKDEEPIDLTERNTILIIKTKIDKKNVGRIMQSHPEHYLRMKETLKSIEFGGKIEAIGIPLNVEIPKWVVPFIDYTTIIQDNLRLFPLEEIGLSKLESTEITHSNMLIV